MKEREAFEAWAQSGDDPLDVFMVDGIYTDDDTSRCWCGWEARAAARLAQQAVEPNAHIDIAHELWAMAQGRPGEGIEEAVLRIATKLSEAYGAQQAEPVALWEIESWTQTNGYSWSVPTTKEIADKWAKAGCRVRLAAPQPPAAEPIGVQACRPEDRAMLQTPAGAELISKVAQAIASPTAEPVSAKGLPPMPEPIGEIDGINIKWKRDTEDEFEDVDGQNIFTADQMRAYLAADRAARGAEPPVAWWNGLHKAEIEDMQGPSFAVAEDTNHDIPLYSRANPTQAQAAQPSIDAVEEAIDTYIADYALDDGDSVPHSPSDDERFMIKDAAMGLLVDPDFIDADPMPRHDHNWRTGEPAAPQAEQDAWSLRSYLQGVIDESKNSLTNAQCLILRLADDLRPVQADREGLVREMMTRILNYGVTVLMEGSDTEQQIDAMEAHARRMVNL